MTSTPERGQGRQQILDDHDQIRDLAEKSAATSSPQEMVLHLGRLLPLLQRHFQHEEEEIDGLHDVIKQRAPHHVNALDELKQEHSALLLVAAELLAAARAGSGSDEGLRERGGDLQEQLTAHEQRETEIFVDAMWTDIGVGD